MFDRESRGSMLNITGGIGSITFMIFIMCAVNVIIFLLFIKS